MSNHPPKGSSATSAASLSSSSSSSSIVSASTLDTANGNSIASLTLPPAVAAPSSAPATAQTLTPLPATSSTTSSAQPVSNPTPGSSSGGSSGTAPAALLPPPPSAGASSANRSSSKRRGATQAGVASSSHVLRTTSVASAAAAAAASSGGGGVAVGMDGSKAGYGHLGSHPPPSNAASHGAPAGNVVIAPPPRVALGAGNQSTTVAPEPSGTSGGTSSSGSLNPAGNSASNSAGGAGGGGVGGGGGSGGGSSAKDSQHHYMFSTTKHHGHHQRQQQPQHHAGTTSSSSRNSHHGSHHSVSSLSSASAAAAAARDKDVVIVQLQRELAIMESEFTRELDKLSKAESETATFWQAKHSRLQQQLAQADSAIQLLRAEVELREAERGELRAGWEDMQRLAAARDEEARQLRQQVRGLKEFVSTATRADGQAASDEVFGDGMVRLANGLQNWVIVHFRRAKLDTDSKADNKADKTAREAFAQLVPMFEDLRHSAKLQLLQSAVSRILVELVFEPYFVGLSPEQSAQLVQVEAFLRTFAGTAEPINQWRALTLSIVSKDAGGQLQTHTGRVTDEVVARVNNTLDAVTDVQQSEARDLALRQLVTSAIELARLLVAQKAEFRVFMPPIMPHQRVLFDAATMEDIGGEEDDDDGLAQREIACVTFPGIIKRGDETGSHLQYTNIICKARVLCASE